MLVVAAAHWTVRASLYGAQAPQRLHIPADLAVPLLAAAEAAPALGIETSGWYGMVGRSKLRVCGMLYVTSPTRVFGA